MRFTVIVRPLVFTMLFTGFAVAKAADITISRGAMLSYSCAGCHGTDGKSPGAIPSLQGKSADFIITSLKEFRSGKRPSTVMGRHARGYTDEEIQLIGNHFADK